MKKRNAFKTLLAYVLAFAMVLPCFPAFSLPAVAASNEKATSTVVQNQDGTYTLSNVNNGKPVANTGFQVGWGQGDFTPSYETNTLPCILGSSQTKLVEEIWDHMYATCVALKDANGKIVIMFSVDLKSISDENDGYTTAVSQIKVLTNSKATAVAAAAAAGHTVTADDITITATHNHNAPAYTATGSGGKNTELLDLMNRWRQVYYNAITEAVTEALADLAPAEAYAGRGDTTGINFVRRFYLEDGTYKGTHTHIDNYSQKANGYLSHESVADPELQTIHFRREKHKDIVMVNWQGHCASANNESSNAFTSDYVHYMRKEVEEKLGVHFIFFNGASGNLVIGDPLAAELGKDSWRLVGVKTLPVIIEALTYEKQLDPGLISVVKDTFTATYRDDGDLPGWNFEEGRCYTEEEIAADKEAVLANGKFSKTNYPTTTRWGQACKIRYELGQDAVEADNYAILKQYQFQSWHEAFRMVARAGHNGWYNEGYKQGTEKVPFSAISCGEMAFAFSSYEMFDQNGIEVKEGSPFEMTFMCAYSNGSNGYIPSEKAWSRENWHATQNRLAVEAGEDPLYLFATDGAGYEVNATRYVRGTGELMAQKLVEMLYTVSDGITTVTVGSDGDYATVADALAAAKTMTWKMNQTLEIRVKEDGLIKIAGGYLMFGAKTIFRENGTKLPIIICSDSERVSLTVGLADPSSYAHLLFTNDYTFRDITLDMASKKFALYAGTGEIIFENVSFGSGSALRLFADNRNTNPLSGWTQKNFDKESERGLLLSSYTFRNTDYNTPSSEAWQGAHIAASGGNTAYTYINEGLTVTPADFHAKIIVENGSDLTRINGYLSAAAPVEVGKVSILMRGGSAKGICADGGNSISYHYNETRENSQDEYQITERNPNVDITVRDGIVYGTGDGIAISGATDSRYGENANIHITVSGGVIQDKVVGVGGHAYATGKGSNWYTGAMESVAGKITIDFIGGILAVPNMPGWTENTSSICGIYVQNKYNCHSVSADIDVNLRSTVRMPVYGIYSSFDVTPSYTGEIPAGAAGEGAHLASGGSVTVTHTRGFSTAPICGVSGGNVEGEVKVALDGAYLGEVDYISSFAYGQRTGDMYALAGKTVVKDGGGVILLADGDKYIYGRFRAAEGEDYTVKAGGSVKVYFNGGVHHEWSNTVQSEGSTGAKNEYAAIIVGSGSSVDAGFEEGSLISVELNGTKFTTRWASDFRLFYNALINADVDILITDMPGRLNRGMIAFHTANVYGDVSVTVDTTADGWGGSAENGEGQTVLMGGIANSSASFYGKGTVRVDGGAGATVTIGKLSGFGAVTVDNTVKNANLGYFHGAEAGSVLNGTEEGIHTDSVINRLQNVDIYPMEVYEATTDGAFVGVATSNSTSYTSIYTGSVENILENVTVAGNVYCGNASTATGRTVGSITNTFLGNVDLGTGSTAETPTCVYGTNLKGSVSGNVIHNIGGTAIFRGNGFYDNINNCSVSGSITTNLMGSITSDTVIKLNVSTSVSGSVYAYIDGATIEEGAVVSSDSAANVYLKNLTNSTFSFKNGTVKGTLSGPSNYNIYSGSFFVAPQGTYVLAGGTIDWNADETHTLTPAKVTGNVVFTRTAAPYIQDAVMLQTSLTGYNVNVNNISKYFTLDNARQIGYAQAVTESSGSFFNKTVTYKIVGLAGAPAITTSAVLQLKERVGIKILFEKTSLETHKEIEGEDPVYTFSVDGGLIEDMEGVITSENLNGDYYEIVLPALGAADFRTGLHLAVGEQKFDFTIESVAKTGAGMYSGVEKKLFEALVDYGAAACGDSELTYYDATEIKKNDVPEGLGGSRGEGSVTFVSKTLLMGDAVGVRLVASSGDLSDVRVVLGNNFDITSKCVINEANGTLDFFINAKSYNDPFTVTVYDGNGVKCITITDTVKHIALQMLQAFPDNVKTRATTYYIQQVLNYKFAKAPVVKPGNGEEVGTVTPIF